MGFKGALCSFGGEIKTISNIYNNNDVISQTWKYLFSYKWINKLFSEENEVQITVEARKVAGLSHENKETYVQSYKKITISSPKLHTAPLIWQFPEVGSIQVQILTVFRFLYFTWVLFFTPLHVNFLLLKFSKQSRTWVLMYWGELSIFLSKTKQRKRLERSETERETQMGRKVVLVSVFSYFLTLLLLGMPPNPKCVYLKLNLGMRLNNRLSLWCV